MPVRGQPLVLENTTKYCNYASSGIVHKLGCTMASNQMALRSQLSTVNLKLLQKEFYFIGKNLQKKKKSSLT